MKKIESYSEEIIHPDKNRVSVTVRDIMYWMHKGERRAQQIIKEIKTLSNKTRKQIATITDCSIYYNMSIEDTKKTFGRG
ncbi:MAG: hypothetical protein WCP52_04830 [Bacteroidota bacterium]